MKGTESFTERIKEYLDQFAEKSETFKKKYENKDKKLEDCITYILNQVKDSGANGFTNNEIYGMALHYYDEDKINVGEAINMKIKIDHYVELTDEEKKELKVEAREKVIKEEMNKMRKKPVKRSNPIPTKEEEVKPDQGSLF